MTHAESPTVKGEGDKGKAAIRVNVCKKGTANKKPIMVGDWEELVSLGAMKLNIKRGATNNKNKNASNNNSNNKKKEKQLLLFSAKGEQLSAFQQVQEDAVIYFALV